MILTLSKAAVNDQLRFRVTNRRPVDGEQSSWRALSPINRRQVTPDGVRRKIPCTEGWQLADGRCHLQRSPLRRGQNADFSPFNTADGRALRFWFADAVLALQNRLRAVQSVNSELKTKFDARNGIDRIAMRSAPAIWILRYPAEIKITGGAVAG
jgi:hypothetical protein